MSRKVCTVCMYLNVCVDLAKQIAKADDFFLQVISLDHQLVTDSLSLLVWIQWEDKLHGEKEIKFLFRNVAGFHLHIQEKEQRHQQTQDALIKAPDHITVRWQEGILSSVADNILMFTFKVYWFTCINYCYCVMIHVEPHWNSICITV